MAKKKIPSLRDFMEEEEKARGKRLNQDEAPDLPERPGQVQGAQARRNLLRGVHQPNKHTLDDLVYSYNVWRNARSSYEKNRREKEKKELFKKQGEANVGRTLDPYGFTPWPGQKIPDPKINPHREYRKRWGEQNPAWHSPLAEPRYPQDRSPKVDEWNYHFQHGGAFLQRTEEQEPDHIWHLDGRRISL